MEMLFRLMNVRELIEMGMWMGSRPPMLPGMEMGDGFEQTKAVDPNHGVVYGSSNGQHGACCGHLSWHVPYLVVAAKLDID